MELKAIAGLCSPNVEISKAILSGVDHETFFDSLSQEIYKRAMLIFRKTAAMPELSALREDLRLSVKARELLASAPRPSKTLDRANLLIEQLSEYKRTRAIFKMCKSVIESLEEPSVDIEELVRFASDNLSKLQKTDSGVDILKFGKDSNAEAEVVDILYGELNDSVIPTGFKTFDSVNGGFFRGSLFTLGGSSGGGKCASPDSLVSLSTLVLELEDGTVLELEPEHRVRVQRGGEELVLTASELIQSDLFLEKL